MIAASVVQYNDGNGIHSAISLPGRKFSRLVFIAGGVVVKRVPLSVVDHCPPEQYHGDPYPLKRAVRQLRKAGKALGISAGARRALLEANA